MSELPQLAPVEPENGDERTNTSSNRIRALQLTGLLDTPPEEAFDQFTALASTILDVPVALVSLIDDDRQFFKSQFGLPQPLATKRETPLTHSFCQYVVESEKPLVIGDARQHRLVSDNLAVTEMGVVAYAGIPLLTPQGDVLGAFCAIDNQPRSWSQREVNILTGLAQAIMAEIAVRLKTRELEDSVKNITSILESITDAFFHLDKNWCFVYINDQGVKLLGHQREQLLGHSVWEVFPDSIGSTFDTEYQRAICTGQPVTFEDYALSLSSWFEVRAYPSEKGLSVYFQDITQRKQNEERLRLLESAVVNASDAVLITEAGMIDEPGPRILYVNKAFTRMTGYRSDEVIGKTPRLLQGPETARQHLDAIRSALENWESVEVELINYRKDGTSFWAQMSIVPVADENGKYTHWISIQRDVSERKRIEQDLQLAKEEADQANRAKSEFLSRMSHELRTPLNAILGFGQILELQDLPPDVQDSVGYIMRGGRHLLDLINEVLDIARVESGRLELSIESIDLHEIVSQVCSLVRPLSAQYNITLKYQALDNQALTQEKRHVMADWQRLQQVLLNLLSNAIKYNRMGGEVEVYFSRKRKGWSAISIRDTGNGIASEDLPKLFTPFERLNASNGSIEGTGLGLTLSRHMMTAMGGVLNVESILGQGTIFTIELPQGAPPQQYLGQLAISSDSDVTRSTEHICSVLCIEDNDSNLRLIESIFEMREEWVLLTALQGVTGLEMARQHQPDLILLDLHLPDIHGREVLSRLQQSNTTKDIPVVVISADAIPAQAEHLMEAGAKDFLTKPLDVRLFLKTVDNLLHA